MSLRRELISKALRRRFEEVCGERIAKLSPREFGEREPFVSEVIDRFANASYQQVRELTPDVFLDTWMASSTDCLTSLSSLALGKPLQLQPATHPSIATFLEDLNEARRDPDRSFHLLVERYAYPLNFGLRAESPVQEHLLTRLMSYSRTRVKRDGIATTEVADLLLKLNLIAINASLTTDLRFLDALNYYYELLPTDRQQNMQHNSLPVSYFALYAQALAAWLSRT